MDELVDILDDTNRVLYSAPKARAYAEGLRHAAVVAFVFDGQGRWVLVEQAPHKQDAGQLVAPVGGHISSGESIEHALRREAFEEAGLRDFAFTYMGGVLFNREIIGHKENHYFHLHEIRTEQPLRLGDESVAYVAFTEDELRRALKDTPERFGHAFHYAARLFYPRLYEPKRPMVL